MTHETDPRPASPAPAGAAKVRRLPLPAPSPRTRRRLAWAAATLVLLALVAWVAVPIAVRRVAESQAAQMLGRPAHLMSVTFNPFTLRLRVEGLSLAGPRPGAPDALDIERLVLDLEWRSIWNRAPVLREVEIDAPVVRVARTAPGRFDFDDVLDRLAKRPPAPPDAAPVHFAIYNVRVERGRVEFDDRPVGRRHVVDALQLGVPVVSDLPGDTEIHVQPRLGFLLDGVRYDSLADARPFRPDRAGTFELHTGGIALAPWLPYWPAALAWHPSQGQVRLDATLSFDAPPKAVPRWSLAGRLTVDDLALVDAANAPLLGWRHLEVRLRDLQPLERQVVVEGVSLDGLDVNATRDAAGIVNLAQAFAGAPRAKQGAEAPSAAASAPAWSTRVEAVDVTRGRVGWRDAQVHPAVAHSFDQLELHAAHVRWPLPDGAASAPAAGDPVRVQLQARWTGDAPPQAAAAPASLAASVVVAGGAVGSDVEVTMADLPIGPWRAYLMPYWSPRSEGTVALRARAHWDGLPETGPAVLDVEELRVDGLQVRDASTPDTYAAWRSSLVQDVHVDFAKRRVSVGRVQLTKPDIGMRRDADGTWQAIRWLHGADAKSAGEPAVADAGAASGATAPAAGAMPSDWQLDIAHAAIEGGRVRWRDAPPGGAVATDLEAVALAVDDVRWPAAQGASSSLKFAARIVPAGARAGAGAGQLSFTGQMGLAPVAWRGHLRLERLPLHLADPYLATASPLFVDHADLGWRGAVEGGVTPAGLRLHVHGDALLTDVRTCARSMIAELSAGAACDLLAWQSLAAKDTDVALVPGHAPVITVADASLDQAHARLVVTEQGHFNLTDLAPPEGAASAPANGGPDANRSTADGAAASPASAPAFASASAPASAFAVSASTSTSASASASASVPAPGDATPDIRIASLHWSDARIDYTDRFVKPNYDADLSGLSGHLGGVSSRSTELAPLELTGRVAGTGLLDVQGRLNPLAKPLALDVTAKATDIELAPLSPYAGKYAGYAIDRGKLSMNVHYRVQPDGHLEASNQVILNQLTFGERVASPTATKLPVLLAVALLKDRHGVIDVDLPIGGSINDPQFSVGGIVVKLILNLLGKALTAPFALLSGGGQDDLSQVLFVPGTARMRPDSDKALDKVAAALNDRPALQLTITGLADDDQEHADMQAANLDTRLAGLRRTELLQQGDANAAEAAPLSADDRARLVRRLYADTKLPDKPRNFLGLAKDLPEAEMETRLKTGLPLPPEAARQLAIQRARAVRDALAGRGLPDERMFVAAPKMHGAGSADPENWLPHAQLELSTK